MSSLTVNKVKTNMWFSFSLSLLHTLFISPTVSNLYNVYNNNYLFDILLTKLLAILLTIEIFKPQLFCSHATSRKADWILTTVVHFIMLFYIPMSSVWCRFWKWKVHCFLFTKILLRLPYLYSACSHTCLFLMLVVVGLRVRWICLCVLCTHCLLLRYSYLSLYTHDFCSYSFCVLFSCEMILGRFHLRDHILGL